MIEMGGCFLYAARPQAIDQNADAVGGFGRLIDALDLKRHNGDPRVALTEKIAECVKDAILCDRRPKAGNAKKDKPWPDRGSATSRAKTWTPACAPRWSGASAKARRGRKARRSGRMCRPASGSSPSRGTTFTAPA